MTFVISEEEYESIEQDILDYLEKNDDEYGAGRFSLLVENGDAIYRALEDAVQWKDNGEMGLGYSRKRTRTLMDNVEDETSNHSVGRALEMLSELNALGKIESNKSKQWDLSKANIDEIGKYCKVATEKAKEVEECFETLSATETL